MNVVPDYDKAVEHGSNDLSQYLAIKGFVEQAAPANVLVFGGGHDVAMYVTAAKSKDEDGLVVVLEEDDTWVEKIKSNTAAVVHKISYARGVQAEEPDGLDPILRTTDWDVILVDPGMDPLAVRDACLVAKKLKQKKTWLFVANCHRTDIAAMAEVRLGKTPCVVKGLMKRNLRWNLYKGEHKVREKKRVGIIKQV